MDVLNKQMYTGRLNASRVIKPVEEEVMAFAEGADDVQPVSQGQESSAMQYDRNLFHMQRAAEAYQMNMFA